MVSLFLVFIFFVELYYRLSKVNFIRHNKMNRILSQILFILLRIIIEIDNEINRCLKNANYILIADFKSLHLIIFCQVCTYMYMSRRYINLYYNSFTFFSPL